MLEWAVRGTGYTHTGIPIGATRHYRVHAVDCEGQWSLSFPRANAVAGGGSRETSQPGAPEQMTLNATPASRPEILLSWVKPTDYGSPITGYTLQAANGRNGPWLNVDPQPGPNDLAYDYGGAPITGYEYRESYLQESFTTTGTTATIRGLDDGQGLYSFEVWAVNAVGEGEWSESIYTQLWPERSEQVRVSTTNITVTEGGTASLNRQPPLPWDSDATCPTEWNTSAWLAFSGPSVKITVRDNDEPP